MIIELTHLQSDNRGIKVQWKLKKYHVHHGQNTNKIIDTCPNFAYNPLHYRQPYYENWHPSHLVCPLQPHQTHPHL